MFYCFIFFNAYDYCKSLVVHWTANLSIIKAEVKTEKQILLSVNTTATK